jgi:UDP-glucose 4-epimerase
MKALVTGIAGFVGSTLSRKLIDDGHEVVGIDSLTDYYDQGLKKQNLAGLNGATVVHGDINEIDLKPLLDGVQWIFHQAGQPGVRKSWGADFEIYTSANIGATQKLLEAARNSPSLQSFVYASSSSVYGDAERYPTAEMDRPSPISPYGVTKLAAEHLCTLYGKSFGVPTTSLRYFTVYGPRQRPDMAFTRFAMSALRGETISIFGDGEQIRDFTFVDDIVRANVLAAELGARPGSVFNVAGGSSVTVNEVLRILRDLSDEDLSIQYQPGVAGDVFRTGGSTKAIREALGWEPIVNLREGIRAQFEWAKSVVETYPSLARD